MPLEISVLSPFQLPQKKQGAKWCPLSPDWWNWICIAPGSVVHSGKCKPCGWRLQVQNLHFQHLKYLLFYKAWSHYNSWCLPWTINIYSSVIMVKLTWDSHSHKQDHNLVHCPFTKGFYKVGIKPEELYSGVTKPDKQKSFYCRQILAQG